MPTEAQLQWINELGVLLKMEPLDDDGPIDQQLLGGAKAFAGPVGGAAGKAASKTRPAPKAKAKAGPEKGLSANAVLRLVDTLVYLANPRFHRKEGAPGPDKLAQSSAEPAVDDVLEQAAEVVRLWSSAKTLPKAVSLWRGTEPRLKSLFAQATDAKNPVVDGSALAPARKAVSEIADYLSMQEVDLTLDQAVHDTPTAELSKALDTREILQFEPALKGFQSALREGGELSQGSGAKKLSQFLDVYLAEKEPAKKLAALQKAGLMKKEASLAELVPFIVHNLNLGVSSISETAVRLSLKAGQQAAAHGIKHWAHNAGRAVGGAIGAYEVYHGVLEIIHGVESGNWHDIAGGAKSVSLGALGVGEAAGQVAAGTSALLTGVVIVAWAVFEAVLMAAESSRWGRQKVEQDAFKSFAADMRKLMPIGKRMSAAVEQMFESEGSDDELSADNRERYEAIALEMQTKLGKGLDALQARHINTSDKHFIGGYPGQIAPLVKAFEDAGRNLVPGAPQSVVDAFERIVTAVQELMARQASSNDVS